MNNRFREVCEAVFQFKEHRDPLIRRTVVNLMPILASYNPMDFSNAYLDDAMSHLLQQLKKERERNAGKYK
jgi:FKBP12-rapamycin complex-associated protein